MSRRRVQSPSTPRSVGDVTTEMCRRGPFSSSYGGSSSSTQKYWPGVKSTSCPGRSKTTSSVPFATSRFSLTSDLTGEVIHSSGGSGFTLQAHPRHDPVSTAGRSRRSSPPCARPRSGLVLDVRQRRGVPWPRLRRGRTREAAGRARRSGDRLPAPRGAGADDGPPAAPVPRGRPPRRRRALARRARAEYRERYLREILDPSTSRRSWRSFRPKAPGPCSASSATRRPATAR